MCKPQISPDKKKKKNMSLLLVGHSSSFSINAVDYTYLVDGFSPSEKYEVNGKDYPIYCGK